MIIFLSYISNSNLEEKVVESIHTQISDEMAESNKNFEEIENLFYGSRGIMDQVNHQLVEEGYAFRAVIAATSKKDIQITIILSNKEATEIEKDRVKSIIYKIVEMNNLDPSAFTLIVDDFVHLSD
nr:hypothetical protein [Lysinibacillus timonensis]